MLKPKIDPTEVLATNWLTMMNSIKEKINEKQDD